MERAYRIFSRRDLPLISHADFAQPREELTLIHIEDGKVVRVSLPRRRLLEVGETVKIDDITILMNLMEE
jgi:hypothetical protein